MTDPLSSVPTHHTNGLVVVGYSTSTSSHNAVRWAAGDAERRRAALRFVHAYPQPQLVQPLKHDVDELLHNEASALLDQITDTTRSGHTHLDVSTKLVQDAPVNALRDESAGAALTVVGAKKSSPLAGAILGSVASAIADVNLAPVAVVHPDHPVGGGGPVVIGIERSSEKSAAIEFAFAEAAARNTELVAVRPWNTPPFEGSLRADLSDREVAAIQQGITTVVSETLTGWGTKYPQVVVTQKVCQGRATTILLEYSRSASIVVVGRRQQGNSQLWSGVPPVPPSPRTAHAPSSSSVAGVPIIHGSRPGQSLREPVHAR
jgi:nucleotide-binding universal stress UspA family protein